MIKSIQIEALTRSGKLHSREVETASVKDIRMQSFMMEVLDKVGLDAVPIVVNCVITTVDLKIRSTIVGHYWIENGFIFPINAHSFRVFWETEIS